MKELYVVRRLLQGLAMANLHTFDFRRDLRHENTIEYLHALLCGVVGAILRLAISVEHRLVTDRQTDRRTDRHTTTAYTELV